MRTHHNFNLDAELRRLYQILEVLKWSALVSLTWWVLDRFIGLPFTEAVIGITLAGFFFILLAINIDLNAIRINLKDYL
ncbi:MAG: hypothetical protein ISR65_12755 [Bacteriovoracaceae bacterium]|nr:hypothetical protein [Bacteriovoracaceae bacterium]